MTDRASEVVGFRRDTPVEAMLRRIAVAASDALVDDITLYGSNFRCNAFEMHRACGNGDVDCYKGCVWCDGCTCSYEYKVGGKVVSLEEWTYYHPDDQLQDNEFDPDLPYHMVKQGKIVVVDGICDFCTASGEYREHGALPRRGAPNFWHRRSGVRVWWHRYIGRGTVVYGVKNNKGVQQYLARIEDDCKKAIAKERERGR